MRVADEPSPPLSRVLGVDIKKDYTDRWLCQVVQKCPELRRITTWP